MVINDGKFSIVNLKLTKYRFEILFFITKDCSTTLRDYGLLKISIWNNAKTIFKKEYDFFRLKSNPSPTKKEISEIGLDKYNLFGNK